MKFKKQLAAKITPEWKKQYINYQEMKEMLVKAVKEAPSPETASPDMVIQYFTSFDQLFFSLCEEELMKINAFYGDQLVEATTRYETLRSALKATLEMTNHKNKSTSSKQLQRLNEAFSEFYYLLNLLQSYRDLNYAGFVKLLAKHDILLSVESGSAWRVERVDRAQFYSSEQVEKLIQDTEATVTDVLTGNDRRRAVQMLKVPSDNQRQGFWLAFRIGMFAASFVLLSTAVVLSILSCNGNDNLQVAFKLYRGPLLTLQLLFLFGINVYGWRIAGVNYVLLFELDPRRHLTEKHIVEIALMLGVMWNLSLLAFLRSPIFNIPPYVHPLAFFVFLLMFIVNPVNVLYRDTRYWFINIVVSLIQQWMFRVLTAPITCVNCSDFLLGDQLISFVTPFLDYHFLICFYASNDNWWTASNTTYCTKGCLITRTIVSLLPGWFRFAQCVRRYRDTKAAIPHLANAGKYFTIIMAWIMAGLREGFEDQLKNIWQGPWFWIWFTSNFIMATYCFFWDIKMDCGFWDSNAKRNKLLRDELIYPSISLYYLFMVQDFILRYIWILSLILNKNGIVTSESLTSIMASLEIFRRFIWNFFRMEYEHLGNLSKLRAVRDIPVKTAKDSNNKIQI
ncbi:solute carrier family 53 member 1-like isoform X2 [Phymastichus coffea]|uniref:solute carrier family 53 member 1-like isoform X2 n=1 Tax=Phymastichus coffea TaxID=108790 RepID=UPI00273A84AF|nr:solute carrier family 53 member 1-like isoform X2 [Phymastichus coffea]